MAAANKLCNKRIKKYRIQEEIPAQPVGSFLVLLLNSSKAKYCKNLDMSYSVQYILTNVIFERVINTSVCTEQYKCPHSSLQNRSKKSCIRERLTLLMCADTCTNKMKPLLDASFALFFLAFKKTVCIVQFSVVQCSAVMCSAVQCCALK